jgi:uncharacterized Fe-S cluster-containing MiaB family protein
MAVSESIDRALKALNETLVEADALVRLASSCNEEDEPPWVYSVRKVIGRVWEANEAVQVVMNQQGLPRLRDLESIDAKRP